MAGGSFGASRPYGIVAGDFNGDGKPDVAVADTTNYTVNVLLGKGDGTFQTAVTYSSGESVLASEIVAAGDFNGDGKLDLVVSSGLYVLLGNGDGTFKPKQLAVPGWEENCFAIAVGDFNGDGKLDLVVTFTGYGNNVGVLLGNGDGTFQAPVSYATGSTPYPERVAVGDLNGDGKLDIIVTNYGDNTISVLLGNGDGTFQPQVTYSTGRQPFGLAIGDFNGDGKPDVGVTNYGDNTISVLLGNGDGTLQPQVVYQVGTQPHELIVGDFNADKNYDLAVANFADGTVGILLGNGDGTFQPQMTYNAGSYPNGAPCCIAAADFNGNGKSGIATANYYTNSVSVFLGETTQTFTLSASNPGPQNVQATYSGDANYKSTTSNTIALSGPTATILGVVPGGPVTFGQAVGLVAIVSPSSFGAYTAGGTVTFWDGATPFFQGIALSNGSATSPEFVPGGGSHSFSATYSGDANFSASSSAVVPFTVNRATSVLSLFSSNPSSSYGASVTFTAQTTLLGSIYPTGTVTFYDGATSIGTSTFVGSVATLTTSSMKAGSHTITASWTGDSNYNPVNSVGIPQTIAQAAPTITWPTPNAIIYGAALNGTQLNATASVPGTFAYMPATGAVLGAGSQMLLATFTPTDATDYTSATKTVLLTVSQATPVISWAAPTAITYGTALSATQLNATASVPGTFTYTPVTGTVLGAGTQTLLATFTPADTTDYTTATKSVSLTVNKATPTLSVVSSNANSIYGAAVTLTATVSTGPTGMVTFYNGSTSIGTGSISGNTATLTTSSLSAGSHSITASWAGNSNYNSANSTVISQTVTQATPIITWSSPSAIAYGTALNNAQLNATASVLGSFTYLPAAGTVLGAGTQTLSATFMPTDTTDYTTATKSVSLMVGQATPIITWSAPAAITFGTALSATQLNATASVTGTFAYTPAAGTVLGVGTQTLSVTFTPNDTIDYNTATDTVSLTVNKDTTTATVSIANSATLGASVTLMAAVSPASSTGTVTFKNGSTTLGTGTLSGGTASMTLAATTANGFAVGSNSISAVYAGDNNDSGSTSSAATLTVTEGTTTTVTASPSSIALGSSSSTQNLTATVTTTSGTPTGTVTFKVGSVTVGSAPLSSGGATVSVAPTTANGFTVGSDTVTASYAPATGSGFIASSGTQTLTVNAPAYTIAPASTSLSLSKGGSQSDTVTLASTTFADTTSWTATASSPLITVSPSSGTAMLSANGSSTASLTITASSSAANHAPRLPWTGGLIAFGAVLAGVPLARRRKRVLAVLLTTLAILTLAFMMSCGGGGGSSTPTPPVSPRSYTVTISGTGGVSSTIAVTVQ
jgi:hypothetical protein